MGRFANAVMVWMTSLWRNTLLWKLNTLKSFSMYKWLKWFSKILMHFDINKSVIGHIASSYLLSKVSVESVLLYQHYYCNFFQSNPPIFLSIKYFLYSTYCKFIKRCRIELFWLLRKLRMHWCKKFLENGYWWIVAQKQKSSGMTLWLLIFCHNVCCNT